MLVFTHGYSLTNFVYTSLITTIIKNTSESIMQKLLAILVLCFSTSVSAGVTEFVDFNKEDGLVILEGSLFGKKINVMLDTASELNYISMDLVNQFVDKTELRLDGYITPKGVDERSRIDTYSDIPLELFGIKLPQMKVPTTEAHENTIILGSGFFKQFIMQIDYPKSKIRLLTHDAIDMKQYANVEMSRAKGTVFPAVALDVNGVKTWVTVDTGDTNPIVLKRSYVNDKGWLTGDLTPKTVTLDDKQEPMEKINLKQVTFGPFELADIPALVPVENSSSQIGKRSRSKRDSGRQVRGVMGSQILSNFNIILDYKNYLMYINVE
jgi:hypothetical protein